MKLPMKTFWMLNKNISRLLAEQDLRALSIVGCQDADSFGKRRSALIEEMGTTYETDPIAMAELERDEAGIQKLKRLRKGGM